MAIYRCNECGFVCEDLAVMPGTKAPCAKCSAPNVFFATVFYVEKLVERYLATRRELEVMRLSEDEDREPASSTNSTTEPNKLTIVKDALHNTNLLATAEQHQSLQAWFSTKQIKANFDFAAVDTTGFFDEAALKLGKQFDVLSGAVDQVRFAYRKDFSWLNIDLSKKTPQEWQVIQDFFRELYGYSLFAKYSYKRQTQMLGVAIQPAQTVRRFFEGGWLEWYVLVNLLSLCIERNREFSCARNVKLEFQNEELRELDVAFLIGKRFPIIVECKTGEFRSEIEKYVKLRRRLGIDKAQFIICSPELTEEQATGLSAMYELTFVSLMSLKRHLEIIV
jgi:hypothetical protein